MESSLEPFRYETVSYRKSLTEILRGLRVPGFRRLRAPRPGLGGLRVPRPGLGGGLRARRPARRAAQWAMGADGQGTGGLAGVGEFLAFGPPGRNSQGLP